LNCKHEVVRKVAQLFHENGFSVAVNVVVELREHDLVEVKVCKEEVSGVINVLLRRWDAGHYTPEDHSFRFNDVNESTRKLIKEAEEIILRACGIISPPYVS